MKKKIILSSILSIVLCLSLIAGSTLALFTSTSKVNIAVNSAKVDVQAVLGDIELYSLDVLQPGMTFENGGTAAVVGSDITLTNITPGDAIKFPIIAQNNSTVKIKYSVTIHAEGPLADALESTVTVGDTAFDLNSGSPLTSPWVTVEAGAVIDAVEVYIVLPVEFEDQSLESATLSVTLNAIQYNGAADTLVTANGAAYDSFEAAIANAKPDKNGKLVITLSGDNVWSKGWNAALNAANGASEIVIKGDGADTTTLSLTHGYRNYFGAPGLALTLEDITLDGDDNNKHQDELNIWFHGDSITAKNVVFKNPVSANNAKALSFDNCSFVYGDSNNYTLWIGDHDPGYNAIVESVSVTNCLFNGQRAIKMAPASAVTSYTATLENNTFENISQKQAIALNYGSQENVVTINNSTVLNCPKGLIEDELTGNAPNFLTIDGTATASVATSQTELKTLANTKNELVYLTAGTYTNVSFAEGVTLIAEEGTVIKQAEDAQAALGSTKNTTIKNVTFEGTNAQRWGYAGGTVVFENCTFKGEGTDSLSWAIHYDGTGGADILYKNCEIYGWVAIGGGASSLVFDGCNFYGNGAFGLCRSYSDYTVKNCTFDYSNVDKSGTRSYGIEALSGATVTVENCTNVNGAIEDIISYKYVGTQYEGNVIIIK